MESAILLPEIALDKFLPIFIESTLVLIFGAAYAAIITLSKMGFFSKKWMPVGYLFWALQTYCLYDFAVMIQSGPMTMKILMTTMVAYLFIPHLYFALITGADERYETTDEIVQDTKQH